ncbi:MAG TPA: response regulator [Bacteroidota bacterium]|nr:response regulator [Bacteroidota bacterium]
MQTTNQNRISVLIVEDEDAFRMVLKEVLSLEGQFEVTDCDAGEKAIELLQKRQFDIVLLDYKMPGLSGLNVLQWMYEQKLDTPVIMLTAAGSEHVAVEAMKLGAYDYLRKEHVDVDHIGIALTGVYERYLYKKERERRERIEIERTKSLTAIESFHSALASIAQIVNNSLSLVSSNLEKREMELLQTIAPEARRAVQEAFAEMRQQYSVVSFAVKSMLNMANTLHGNFNDAKFAQTGFQQKKSEVEQFQIELVNKKEIQ